MMRLQWLAVLMAVFLVSGCANRADNEQTKAEWPLPTLDQDGDCQRTRTEVLLRDHIGLVQWASPSACSLAAGEWQSWGRDITLDTRNVRVVPLVPAENARASGAADWPREKKVEFMNDMENLIILDPVSVEERNGFGPDRWIPLKTYWCEYSRRWESVKQRYGLSMSEEERGAVAHMKKTCETAPEG